MPTVLTSVAVATPPSTAARISIGSSRPGIATKNACAMHGIDGRCASSVRSRARAHDRDDDERDRGDGRRQSPATNSAPIDTPVTEPMMISTRLGGIVSDMAAERREQRDHLARGSDRGAPSRGRAPARQPPCRPLSSRRSPRPDTSRRSARCPGRRADARRGCAIALTRRTAIPRPRSRGPSKTNNGTASSTRFEMPSSMRPTTVLSGTVVVSAR